jgi:hypothetical protein
MSGGVTAVASADATITVNSNSDTVRRRLRRRTGDRTWRRILPRQPNGEAKNIREWKTLIDYLQNVLPEGEPV